MKTKRISVALDFTRTPGGRYVSDGKWSGEEFLKRFLLPALSENDIVEVDLDGVVGFTTSFLEEAFGGAVRELGPAVLHRLLPISTSVVGRSEKANNFMRRAVSAGEWKR